MTPRFEEIVRNIRAGNGFLICAEDGDRANGLKIGMVPGIRFDYRYLAGRYFAGQHVTFFSNETFYKAYYDLFSFMTEKDLEYWPYAGKHLFVIEIRSMEVINKRYLRDVMAFNREEFIASLKEA